VALHLLPHRREPAVLRDQFILPLASELIIDLFAGGGASTGIEQAQRARFASHVTVAEGDSCWEWRGNRSKRRDGSLSYGRFCIGKDCQLAHRVAWQLVNGEIPDGQVVRHRCDNVGCVRPSHLLLGTQADNLQDMRERGRAFFNRFAAGAAHPKAKLTDLDVIELRSARDVGASFVALGERFGIHPSTAHDIATGRTRRAA
jgi:hypothetical protein